MIKLLFKLSFPKFSVGNLKFLSPSTENLRGDKSGNLNFLRFPRKELENDKDRLRKIKPYPCHLEQPHRERSIWQYYDCIKLNRPLAALRPSAFANLRLRMFEVTVLSLLLITLTNCITIAKRTEYLEAPILVKPFTCSSYEGYEADYIDCRFKTLTEAYFKRKRFLEEQAELEADPKNKKQILLVISETDRKIKSLESWQASSLPGARKRDEKWHAEEEKRQAEADRLARIEKLRLEKEEREQELAEMRRTGKKNASECKNAKSGLQDCIQSAKMSRQGAQVFGAITGVNTSAFQDLSSNVELACKTFKATITIACAFAGESDFAEVMSEIQVLDKEIKAAEKRR